MQYIACPQQLAFVEITSYQNVQAVVNITRYEYNDFDLLNRIGYNVCKISVMSWLSESVKPDQARKNIFCDMKYDNYVKASSYNPEYLPQPLFDCE